MTTVTTERAILLGGRLARRLFAERGNHSEMHVSELELAAMLALAAQLGTEDTTAHAVALGRKGGQANKGKTTTAKAKAARANGRKGGRPKKTAARLATTVDGQYMILVNGFQWGGDYDASGAGNATFATISDARGAWEDTGHTDALDTEDAFAAHQAADPHCTCNDCMADFIGGQSDDLRRTE